MLIEKEVIVRHSKKVIVNFKRIIRMYSSVDVPYASHILPNLCPVSLCKNCGLQNSQHCLFNESNPFYKHIYKIFIHGKDFKDYCVLASIQEDFENHYKRVIRLVNLDIDSIIHGYIDLQTLKEKEEEHVAEM